jgi:hypothetical protein
MKLPLIIFAIFFIFSSCKKQSQLSSIFECDTVNLKNLNEYSDFKQNFKITIPNNWKTELYYNEFQSEIFTADTTKQLSETYVLDASFNFGNLNFNTDFHKKTDSIIAISNLEKTNSGNFSFKSNPAYWYLVNGTKKGFNYHQFNLIVKLSDETYFTAYTEVYGDSNINERICESIAIFDKIKFLQ